MTVQIRVTIASALLLALSLTSCSSPSEGPKEQSPSATEATSQAAEAETATATPSDLSTTDEGIPSPFKLIDVDLVPQSWVEHGTYEYLPPEARAQVDRLNAMSIEEFRQQPQSDQVAFGRFVISNAEPRMNNSIQKLGSNLTYNWDIESIQDTEEKAQSIQDNKQYNAVVSNFLIINTGTPDAIVGDYDSLLAQKLGSLSISEEDDFARLDQLVSEINIKAMPSLQETLDNRCIVTNFSEPTEDGSIAYDCSSPNYEIVGNFSVPVPYTSLIDGSAQIARVGH